MRMAYQSCEMVSCGLGSSAQPIPSDCIDAYICACLGSALLSLCEDNEKTYTL